VTIIAAQQPYFLPDFNFFLKIIKSDVFLLVNHLKFRKQSKICRVLIKNKNHKKYLSVPVVHSGDPHPYIYQVKICNTNNWRSTHLRTLESEFRSYPYFEFYFPLIKDIYLKQTDFLVDFLIDLISLQLDLLNLKKVTKVSTDLEIRDSTSLKSWMIRFKNPHLLIQKNELDYYKKNFPEFNYQIMENPKTSFLPKPYHTSQSFIKLLFLKGPESILFLKKTI
jgi:hypothetical protein